MEVRELKTGRVGLAGTRSVACSRLRSHELSTDDDKPRARSELLDAMLVSIWGLLEGGSLRVRPLKANSSTISLIAASRLLCLLMPLIFARSDASAQDGFAGRLRS